jgi:glycosyltransferase involved in cell wall biosynthesis
MHSVAPDNRYGRRLADVGVSFTALPSAIAELASDWAAQDRVVLVAAVCTSWLLWLPAAIVAVFHRRSYRRCLDGMVGRWRAFLSYWIHKDRLDGAFAARMDLLRLAERPDIVHVFRSELSAAVAWSARHKFPTVYSEVTTPRLAEADQWRERGAQLDAADITVAVSMASRTGLRTIAGMKGVIEVIPPALSVPPSDGLRPPFTVGNVRLVYIGRLSTEKGIDVLLRALPLIRATSATVRLVLAGTGPQEAELQRQVREMELMQEVHFSGAFDQDDLADILCEADIVVLPSLVEGMPLVLIEAMAYGRPVVATAVGGIPELVHDGITGRLVQPNDPEDLATALSELIDDSDQRIAMGAAGRQLFLDGPHTEAAFISSYLAVYETAMTSCRRRDRLAGHSAQEGTQ